MKKLITIITLACYVAITCGFNVSTHYCMNQVASVHLFENKTDRCGKCGMETHESKGCCHDEVKLVKIEQDQNKVAASSFDFSLAKSLPVITVLDRDILNGGALPSKKYSTHSPPLLSSQDNYLLFCIFRI